MNEVESRGARIRSLGYDYDVREKERIAACNLCGSSRWVVIDHRDRYGFPASASACAVCGLTFLDPRLTPREYGEFYRSIYRPLVSAYHGREIDDITVQEEQRLYCRELERLVAPFLDGGPYQTILDVGGSTGVVASWFAERFGLAATVVDPAPAEIAHARDAGIEVVNALVEEWDGGGRTFDVVGLFQTIDHLLDIRGTLEKIHRLLPEDGLFLVDIVDFRVAYLKSGSTEGAIKIDHPFYLTEETMECYLSRVGFEWVRKAYSEDRHLIAYVCRKGRARDDCLPEAGTVRDFFREIRAIQGTLRRSGGAK